jgi:hypothetical protein
MNNMTSAKKTTKRRTATRWALLMMILLWGCASVAPPGVQQRAAEVRERTAKMDAASNRIIVASGSQIPEHPTYTTLGPVSGYCEQTPQGDSQTLNGDTMKQSAVRKYGDRVDAIVDSSAAWMPISSEGGVGYWRCSGTAVSFAESK